MILAIAWAKEHDLVGQDVVWYIQFRKRVAWLAMLNLQEPWSDHLIASAQP